MPLYTIYDKNNGQILSELMVPVSILKDNYDPRREGVKEGPCDSITHYIDLVTDLPVAKTEIPVSMDKSLIQSDGVDEVTFTLPVTEPNGTPIEVYVKIKEYGQPRVPSLFRGVVSDGVFFFTTNIVKTYEIEFKGTNYLPKTILMESV